MAVEKEIFKYFDQEKEKELMRLILRLVSRDKRQLPTIYELKGIVSIEEIEERKGEELKNGEKHHTQRMAYEKSEIQELSLVRSSKIINSGNLE